MSAVMNRVDILAFIKMSIIFGCIGGPVNKQLLSDGAILVGFDDKSYTIRSGVVLDSLKTP